MASFSKFLIVVVASVILTAAGLNLLAAGIKSQQAKTEQFKSILGE